MPKKTDKKKTYSLQEFVSMILTRIDLVDNELLLRFLSEASGEIKTLVVEPSECETLNFYLRKEVEVVEIKYEDQRITHPQEE